MLESNLNKNIPSLAHNTGLKGRDLSNDLLTYFIDVSLRNMHHLFDRYEVIESISTAANILKIKKEVATEYMECLLNLKLIERTPQGYKGLEKKFLNQGVLTEARSERIKNHTWFVLQVLALYENAHAFSDLTGTYASTDENINELHEDMKTVLEKFKAKNNAEKKENLNRILNMGLVLSSLNTDLGGH